MNAATKTWLWIVGSISAAIAVPPLLLRAQPAGFHDSLREINMMTQVERNGLDRRYRDFLDLSEGERQKYRDMHQQLLDDQADGRGSLSLALDDYYAWVQTLPQNQREELRNTTDPAERAALAHQFLEQQRARDADAETRAIMSDPDFRRRFRGSPPPLRTAQLARVMQEVEASVTMTQTQRERLDPPDGEPLAGMERYLELFRIVGERGDRTFSRVLDAADTQRIIDAIPDERIRNWINSSQQQSQKLRFLLLYLAANLRAELDRERLRNRPDAVDLEEFVNRLEVENPAQFDQLMQLEPNDFRKEAERLYAASQQSLDFQVIFKALPPEIRQWLSRQGPGGRPPRGEDRPGRPRDRDRRRPDPDRPPRDPPRD